jgi:hypothetical protein
MSFLVELIDAMVLIDLVVIFLQRISNHADLITLIDKVTMMQMSAD